MKHTSNSKECLEIQRVWKGHQGQRTLEKVIKGIIKQWQNIDEI